MDTYNQIYIAIDLHSNNSVIGSMNKEGEYISKQQVPTTARNLVNQVASIPAEHKYLTIEQGNMSFWAAEQLRRHDDRLIICDPGYNRLICRGACKNDHIDTINLCRLLRLGELKEVWRPTELGIRRLFYGQIKEYQRLVKTLSIHPEASGPASGQFAPLGDQ